MNEVILKAERPLAVYSEFRQQLNQLKADNAATVFDYTDKKGNAAARSHIHKLRQIKGGVEKARKAAKQESLDYGRMVDAEARDITDELDAMIEVHARPIREIEEREELRKQQIRAQLDCIRAYGTTTTHEDGTPLTAEEYRDALDKMLTVELGPLHWAEFADEAEETTNVTIGLLERHLAGRIQYEAEQAELTRLRKEQEEREAKEAAEAAERERQEREERLRKEGEERARKEAERKAQAEKEAQERAVREAKEAQERAVREAKEAQERAEQEKQEALERAARAEKEAEERARKRAEEEKQREIEEQAKREANKKHRAAINNAALKALVDNGVDENTARSVVVLIAEGKIPAVSIRY